MKRTEQKNRSANKTTAAREPRRVPLMVPHGGAEAGRDFESAFEVLPGDEPVTELWQAPAGKGRVGS